MWLLSSDGDFLHGKQVWLKPGKKYLFGRVKSDGVCHSIDDKTVSRKHLVIEVDKVQPGDGSRIHVKSKVTLHDQSSKGTVVNGKTFLKQSKELGGRDEYVIRLGKASRQLKLAWCPMVLSFSFRSKRLDAKNPLADARSRLEELDIKTVEPYVVGKTSYVVQNKRNTAKGLQALVNGKWIVDKSYIDAIVYAATPLDLENEEALCPLEEDFDHSWPDAQQHLPPRGKEPTNLPDSAYGPDPERLSVFEGYVFVFCEKGRFDELQGPITNGHGKALFYELDPGKTTADDIVDYMRKAGGNKGLAVESDGSGGVILVEFPGSHGHEAWAQDVQQRVRQLTGQKVLSTGEFLGAILQNNALQLCQPASREAPPTGSQHQALESNDTQAMNIDQSDSAPASTNVETAAVGESQDGPRPAKRLRARPYVPRFKAFDDGFDMDSIPEYTLEKDGEPTQENTQAVAMESIAEESQAQSEAIEDEMVAELLPGAAAMRQRVGGMKRRNPTTPPPEPAKKAKRPKLDVKEAARQRREAADEAVMAEKKDMASFQAVVDGMTVAEMQNLAITEEMPVHPRQTQSQSQVPGDPRWDGRWNGRKNFKKFRRKGNPGGAVQHRIQTVIVPLEEVVRKDYGLGDGYAGSENRRVTQPVIKTPAISQAASRAESRSRAGSQAITKSQGSVLSAPDSAARSQKRPRETNEDSDDDGLRFRFRRRRQQ